MDAFLNPPCAPGDAAIELAAPGTRHHALLTSNEPPDSSEITFMQSVISKTDDRLAYLDDEISRLENTLQRLKEERSSLCSYHMRNKAILSPLRRMPAEILGEIFGWTLPSTQAELNRLRFDIADSPWVLTRVSGRWRAISLSSPSLWSRLVVDYQTDDLSSSYPLSIAQAQIQHARNLKIHFYGSEKADSLPQIEMFQLLLQHSSRWEELSLGLTSKIVPFLPALRNRLPSLRRLWVCWDAPESQTEVESIDCFESASSLVDFGIHNEFSFIPTPPPAHQLTRYHLDAPWEEHKRILELAHNLVEVDITADFYDASSHWPDVDKTYDLPYLRRLYVSGPQVLDYLRSPSLETLTLRVHQSTTVDEILLSLQPFLDRSTCSLWRISFRGFPDAHKTPEILRKLSSITELGIVVDNQEASEGINLLMSSLTVSQVPGSTVVAPQLRRLFFACEDETFIDYRIYLEMLKSRWRVKNCALDRATLAIEDGPGPDSETLHSLEDSLSAGLGPFGGRGRRGPQ
ncbi:F-box domain-containing protein [Mycena venus]|uniref:F-box domain-containing protein n=1 Tax=Mycena venus TaxID=2733690 RepID=A0A8H6XF53_9AGAR|nr:F-box domain-containing protein [Mycena venus]